MNNNNQNTNKILIELRKYLGPQGPKWRVILSWTVFNMLNITFCTLLFDSDLNLRFWIALPILSFIAAYAIWAIMKNAPTEETHK